MHRRMSCGTALASVEDFAISCVANRERYTVPARRNGIRGVGWVDPYDDQPPR